MQGLPPPASLPAVKPVVVDVSKTVEQGAWPGAGAATATAVNTANES
jgi:hypothetical protein